jgi:hypothetical protein
MIEEMRSHKEMNNAQDMKLERNKIGLLDRRKEASVAQRDRTDIVKMTIDEKSNQNTLFIIEL